MDDSLSKMEGKTYFICFTMVLLPDSPAPVKKRHLVDYLNTCQCHPFVAQNNRSSNAMTKYIEFEILFALHNKYRSLPWSVLRDSCAIRSPFRQFFNFLQSSFSLIIALRGPLLLSKRFFTAIDFMNHFLTKLSKLRQALAQAHLLPPSNNCQGQSSQKFQRIKS